MRNLLCAAFLLIGCLFSVTPVSATDLPTEYFASLPDLSRVRLSPDGENIIWLVRVETKSRQGQLIQIFNTKTGKQKNIAFTDNEKYKVRGLRWANEDTVILYADFPASRYGTPTTESRIVKLDTKTGEIKPVIPRSLLRKLKYQSNQMSNVIDFLPDDKDHILVSLAGYASGPEESVLKVNLNGSGKSSFEQRTKRGVIDWMTDAKGRVRIGIAREETTYKIRAKLAGESSWRTLWEFEVFSRESVWPLAFGAQDNELYVSALHNGKDAVFKVDLTDKTLAQELVHFDENYDVDGYIRRSGITKEVVGVGNTFWHPKWKAFQKGIDKALPDTNNHIISVSKDERRYIVYATSDTQSGMYLYGDRDQNTLGVLGYRYARLSPDVMSEKKAISYKARDGLEIEGFLTLPKGKPESNLPTIIFPHGGPISYDSDGFDYWTQFLASKGYAVLQMNFRGSSGYGHDFMQQGLASWGQAMQDDVADGTKWLIDQNIADKDKICILGASYGGYAALMGGVKTPELYRCIVSFAGVTDVERLVKQSRRYTNYDIVKKQIGSDYDQLWDNSPLKYAEQISKPVLLIHGSKDRVVRVNHSERMYDELKDEGKNVKYIELDGGDHYLSNNRHRLTTFKAIESFLSQYNPTDK